MALRRPPTRIEIKPEEALDEFEEFMSIRRFQDPRFNKAARNAAARMAQADMESSRTAIDAAAATVAERIGMNRPRPAS